MAKPNYSFEKRQREIAKKKKKEEKRIRKLGLNPDTAEEIVPPKKDPIKDLNWPTRD
tara:strand:+ start:119 stop:289 length:171 start_codon:yes stop_codon:yes gene_type:complete